MSTDDFPRSADADEPAADTTADASTADRDADDWWPDADTGPSTREGTSVRTWILAGAGALVIAGAAIAGISALSSSDSVATATAGTNAAGAFPGAAGRGMPGQGMPGQGMPGAPAIAGTVSTVDGSSFTVKTTSDSVDVTTSTDTTVVAASSGAVSDIEKGDRVFVVGSRSDSEVAAARITAGDAALLGAGGPGGAPPGAPAGSPNGGAPSGNGGPPANGAQGLPSGRGAPVAGVVESIDGSTLKITTTDGSAVTITTTSSTDVTLLRSAAVSDIETGDEVTVMGPTSDGTVAASRIRIGQLDVPGNGAPGATV